MSVLLSVLLLVLILNILCVNSECDWNLFGAIAITINLEDIEPTFKYINYSGYVALIVLYIIWNIIYFLYTCFCVKSETEGRTNGDIELATMTGNNPRVPTRDQIERDVDKAYNNSFLKSKLALILQFSDLINTGIFLYFFKYYTQINICSHYWVASIAIFSIKIIFFIIDFFHSCLCGGCLQIKAVLIYDAIKYHFNIMDGIFKIYYSWPYLHNLPTFWNLTLSMTLYVQSGLLTLYTYYSNFIKNIENVAHGYVEIYAGIKRSCCQKCCGKIRQTYEYFLMQIIILIPVFLLVNTITASFYLIGQTWIIMFSSIWILGVWLMLYLMRSIDKNIHTIILIFGIYCINACTPICAIIYFLSDFVIQYFGVYQFHEEFGVDKSYSFIKENWQYLSPYFSAMFLYIVMFVYGTYVGCKQRKKNSTNQDNNTTPEPGNTKKPTITDKIINYLAPIFWWLIWILPILVSIAVYNLIVRYVLIVVGLFIIICAAFNGIVAIIFHAMAENAKIIVSVIIIIAGVLIGLNWKSIHQLISKQ